MSWGWLGLFKRALELPAGVEGDFAVAPSPLGRARLRYNRESNALELSLNGSPYFPIAGGSAGAGAIETAFSTTVVGISDVADTTLPTLPSYATAGQAVIIMTSIELFAPGFGAGEETVTLKLFRDGVEVSSADRYVQVIRGPALFPDVSSPHWVDESTPASAVYSIRARASVAPGLEARVRRATVHSG